MGKKGAIFITILVVLFIGVFSWGLTNIELGKIRKAEEQYSYYGTITALKHTEQLTKVWINSEPKVVNINGRIEFAVGEYYKITIDGNGKLINAEFVEKENE